MHLPVQFGFLIAEEVMKYLRSDPLVKKCASWEWIGRGEEKNGDLKAELDEFHCSH